MESPPTNGLADSLSMTEIKEFEELETERPEFVSLDELETSLPTSQPIYLAVEAETLHGHFGQGSSLDWSRTNLLFFLWEPEWNCFPLLFERLREELKEKMSHLEMITRSVLLTTQLVGKRPVIRTTCQLVEFRPYFQWYARLLPQPLSFSRWENLVYSLVEGLWLTVQTEGMGRPPPLKGLYLVACGTLRITCHSLSEVCYLYSNLKRRWEKFPPLTVTIQPPISGVEFHAATQQTIVRNDQVKVWSSVELERCSEELYPLVRPEILDFEVN